MLMFVNSFLEERATCEFLILFSRQWVGGDRYERKGGLLENVRMLCFFLFLGEYCS